MQVQVSLTIEIPATASISEMEQRIQEAGQQAMREAGVGPTRPYLVDNLRLMHNMGEAIVAIDNIP